MKPTCSGESQLRVAWVAGSYRWIRCFLMSTNQSAWSRSAHTGPSPSSACSSHTGEGGSTGIRGASSHFHSSANVPNVHAAAFVRDQRLYPLEGVGGAL